MKVFTVKVDAISAGEEVRADFIVEQKKGETWNRMKVVTVTSGTPESERKFVLQDNERLLLEGQTNKVVIYDREQNMSKIVDADPEVRKAQEAAEVAQKQANVAREAKQNEVVAGLATQAQQEAPKTNLGNPVPPQTTALPSGAPKGQSPLSGGVGKPPAAPVTPATVGANKAEEEKK